MPKDLCHYSAVEAVNAVKSGEITAEALVHSCLERYDLRENTVRAWEFVDRDLVIQQARELDRRQKNLPLHGVPIGIKDIIDTDNMPTCYGSPIYNEFQPATDADCIRRLKEAGAVIMGKTVTTEFAYLNPGKTRNPHKLEHTPGGSSSGSAAAVADFHVALALGTQTAGSIIRPASFCGVVGYKPTFNSYSLEGVHAFAPSLDTLGGFARSVVDIALLHNVLAKNQVNTGAQKPDKVAVLRGPYWQHAEDETRDTFDQLDEILRFNDLAAGRIDLGDEFMQINDAQKKIQLNECTHELGKYYRERKDDFSDNLLRDYEYGLSLDKQEMAAAYAIVEKCREKIAGVFSEYQLILTAASPGRAPAGLQSTGDPVFNRMWTAMGLPCICLPFPQKQAELPLGVQLVGPFSGDADLLNYAAWLEEILTI